MCRYVLLSYKSSEITRREGKLTSIVRDHLFVNVVTEPAADVWKAVLL